VNVTSRDALLSLLQAPERVAEVAWNDVPDLLGELEVLRVRLYGRLLRSGIPSEPQRPADGPDRLLSPQEAGSLLGVTTRWLYRHARRLPFTRRMSRRVLRFSETGLRQWLERQGKRL
jgi:predicted DNA-binding transcriptional regulator AlpA